jgi:hypothetical protein
MLRCCYFSRYFYFYCYFYCYFSFLERCTHEGMGPPKPMCVGRRYPVITPIRVPLFVRMVIVEEIRALFWLLRSWCWWGGGGGGGGGGDFGDRSVCP